MLYYFLIINIHRKAIIIIWYTVVSVLSYDIKSYYVLYLNLFYDI